MKRILAMILALVLCLGLCACGESQPTEEEVKSAIIKDCLYGTIENDYGHDCYTINFSNNNEATVLWEQSAGYVMDSHTYKGTYEIKKDQIIISDGGMDFFIDYTFQNGQISMTLKVSAGDIPLIVRDFM